MIPWIDVNSAYRNLDQERLLRYKCGQSNKTLKFSRLEFKCSGCDFLYRLHDIVFEISAYCWVWVQGYNELLYAHLLDSDGARLTYTHFTAKVRIQLKGIVSPGIDRRPNRGPSIVNPDPLDFGLRYRDPDLGGQEWPIKMYVTVKF